MCERDPLEAAARAYDASLRAGDPQRHFDYDTCCEGALRAAIVAYLRARAEGLPGNDHFVERCWLKALADKLEVQP